LLGNSPAPSEWAIIYADWYKRFSICSELLNAMTALQ
jgi:hypothetical protein